jgi:MoxR-like ATPase
VKEDGMTASETATDFARQIEAFQRDLRLLTEQLASVIVGHEAVLREVLLCLLAGGHVLLEGVPGLGKTLLVRTIAEAAELQFSRVQFTPDLMPADITGTNLVQADEAGSKAFRFQPGPIFANLVLADEINRATPKTQSAVLEAMQEQTVSVARTTHKLPAPFFVLATQNPLEMEGTYPLPEAQLDRFLFKVRLATPEVADLVGILDRTTGSTTPHAHPVITGPRLMEMQALVRQVPAAGHVKEYVARIVRSTHPPAAGRAAGAGAGGGGGGQAIESVAKYVRYGSSPRGAQAILLAAKALALQAGRANVAFSDIEQVAAPALRHRLILSFEGQADDVDTDDIIRQVLQATPKTETV